MAEIGFCLGMPEMDACALKEALFAQQQLLQKLYDELDEEREASATAASEALSMILRLQGEKAAVKMEADQYKRMAEEKMCHADLSLEVFEDVIYQKEMEIASLEFQVQAYRYKLLSMGYTDLGPSESRLLDNLFLQRGDVSNGGKGLVGGVRRLNSLPSICLKDPIPQKGAIKRPKSVFPGLDVVSKIVEENPDLEGMGESLNFERKQKNSLNGDFGPVWEQIRRLGDHANEISECKDTNQDSNDYSTGVSRSRGIVSCVSAPPRYTTSEWENAKSDQMNHCENLNTAEVVKNSASPTTIQDIFEVPQSEESCKSHEVQVKEWSKLESEGEDRLGKPDLVTDQTDWIKNMLLSLNHDKTPSKSRLREKVNSDCDGFQEAHKARVPKHRSEFQQLSERIERLETERNARSQEIVHENDEEMNLLREIREQLNSIQREIRHENKRKDTQLYDSSLLTLSEAMLHFWL
ncbi:hypothetical protein BT93_C1565 [Corymbia citriodora subsp. variegata]|nr:hypothetical protein BT93_C1565 [Corymbia citriodora subsp. variegata]